ncbi:MAG: endonuclease/exonuclease/phosphatase family protein [Deltaproteobacteria bacterium]|nr:endonuclease/exonuclease/phosphatase family protein [Deltaproteobacteria bacterium]
MLILRVSLTLAILTQIFFSANNQLPTWFWFQELSINFGAYWLVLHVLTIALLLLFGRRLRVPARLLSVFLLALFSFQYLYQLRSFLFFPPRKVAAEMTHSLRVVLATVGPGKQSVEETGTMLARQSADVVGLLGASSEALVSLGLTQVYPYYREIPREDGFGAALYSRFPITGDVQTSVGELLPPIISTQIALDEKRTLPLILFQAPEIFERESFYLHRLSVRRVSTPLRQTSGPLLVFGNFNASEFSGSYKRFRNAGKLRDAMAGFGYYRTWDASGALWRLNFDHLLYRKLGVRSFERLPSTGAKHFPISVEFSW